jgi:hypothetical protein
VAIYLVLELISQQFLRPRVYKKANDTNVDLCAKLARPPPHRCRHTPEKYHPRGISHLVACC